MDIIVQYAAVFTLLLYKYVFYSFCSIVKIHCSVYRYSARNLVFFIGIFYWHFICILGKFGLGKIFGTLVAALLMKLGEF